MLFFMRLVGGLALLGVGFWLGILPARVPSPTLAAEAAGIGALLLLATGALLPGLVIGTIALVSPIASSFAAIPPSWPSPLASGPARPSSRAWP